MGKSPKQCIQVDTRLSALRGPVTRCIKEVIGSVPASETAFATVLAAAEADFYSWRALSVGPSLAPTEDGAVHFDDDPHDARASQEPEEFAVSEKDLVDTFMTEHLVKDANEDIAAASSSSPPITPNGWWRTVASKQRLC